MVIHGTDYTLTKRNVEDSTLGEVITDLFLKVTRMDSKLMIKCYNFEYPEHTGILFHWEFPTEDYDDSYTEHVITGARQIVKKHFKSLFTLERDTLNFTNRDPDMLFYNGELFMK